MLQKKIFQVTFNVEQRKIEDIILALAKAITTGALKNGFRIDYVETVDNDNPRYSDDDVDLPKRNVTTQSQEVVQETTITSEYQEYHHEYNPSHKLVRAAAGGKQVKHYVLEYMLMVGSATSDEVGTYLVNESARNQVAPFSSSSASPSLSLLAQMGILIKPSTKKGEWKLVPGIDHKAARDLVRNTQIYKRRVTNGAVL